MSDSDYSDFEVIDEPNNVTSTPQQQALLQIQSQLLASNNNNNSNNNNSNVNNQDQQAPLNDGHQSIQTITQAASAMAAAMAAQQLLASAAAICGIDLASLTNLAAMAGQPTPINAPEQLMAAAVAAAAFLSPNNPVPEDLSVAQQHQLQLQQLSIKQPQSPSQQENHIQQQQQQQQQQQLHLQPAPLQQQNQTQHNRQNNQTNQLQQQLQQQAQQQQQQRAVTTTPDTSALLNVAAGLSINAVPSLLQQHHHQLQQHLAKQQQTFHQQQQQNQNQNHTGHLHGATRHHHSLGGHHHHSSIQTQQQLLATNGFNPMAVVSGSGQQTEILTPTHLRKAKLMFFYVRYPNSSTLKECFRDVRFNKNNTAQLVKWFSNFREFYYIQMEKFAREAVNDQRITCKEHIVVNYDHELINQLNNHYNKNRHIELPEVFRAVVEETLRHFFDAIHNRRDQEQSWKKAIYKLIARLDQEVPDLFKTDAFNEHLE